MTRILSATLVRDSDDAIACAGCGHALGPAGQPWKPAAVLSEVAMKGLGGAPYSAADDALLRRFLCPGCCTLLDSETALPGDPFLEDVVEA